MDHKNKFSYKPYEIIEKTELAPETFLFKLKGKFKFNPGQFVQVSVPRFGEATFAPCSDTENTDSFELCIRAAGSTTDQMVQKLVGDELLVRGPYGNGWPVGKLVEKDILIIAGGIGLVPMRALMHQILKYRSEFRKVYLVCGFKSDQHIIFEEDLKAWQKKITGLEVCVEHAGRDFWGHHGLVTEPLKKIKFNPKKLKVLICGPEVMTGFCLEELLGKGVKEENIYISYERRMECGIGVCQHCNIGKYLVCKDGPVFSWDKIKDELTK